MNIPEGPLVSPEWLFENLAEPGLVILDASWHMPAENRDPAEEYGVAHIPGAVFFDIDGIAGHTTHLPHMLPQPQAFATAARRLGVEQDSIVVVYDSIGVFSAPRVWWTFRAMGLDTVFVLDGGLKAWIADGRPVEGGWREAEHGEFKAHLQPELVVDLNQVRKAVEDHKPQLVDARSSARFRGEAPEPRAGLREGHMPGAHNVPWAGMMAEDGTLVSPEALTAAFTAGGLDLKAPIIATCGSGISAAILALGLARLGRWDVPVYDGSWAEWGALPDTPVATGA